MPKRHFTRAQINEEAKTLWDLFDIKDQPRWLQYLDARPSELKHRERTIRALVSDWTDEVSCERGIRIERCGEKGRRCREVFCPRCRHEIQNVEERKVLNAFRATSESQLRFLTILLPVSYDPIRELPGNRNKAKNDLHNAVRPFPSLRFYGAFEIDVKTPALVEKHRTADVLDQLGMDRGRDDPAYLLHLHAVVDLGGAKRDAVSNALRKKFNTPYQVRLAQLRKDKAKTENLSNIARYMCKYRLQYANNIYGRQIYGRATYGDFYEQDVVRTISKAYSAILSRQTSVRSYKNVGTVCKVTRGI